MHELYVSQMRHVQEGRIMTNLEVACLCVYKGAHVGAQSTVIVANTHVEREAV